MAINFSEFGFFDGVTKVDQINWPKYLDSYVTDGVVKGYGNDLQVYGNSSGMKVLIKTGKVFVHTHFGILSNEVELGIPAADPTYGRKDLVVARAVYASAPNSIMVLDVKTGVPSSNPVPPTLTKTAGVTWEVPLAIVSVAAGASTISSGAVADARIYSVVPFERGGVGSTTQAEALSNIFGGSQLSVANGGTGASTATGARTNLGFGGAAILQTVSKQVTLTTGGWSSGVITISDSDVAANSIILLDPVESSRSAFFASDIRKNSQSSGSYSLRCTTTPTANLVCDVVIMKVG
jgi:hypothetical protein